MNPFLRIQCCLIEKNSKYMNAKNSLAFKSNSVCFAFPKKYDRNVTLKENLSKRSKACSLQALLAQFLCLLPVAA